MKPRPAFADDLTATQAHAFALLARGVADRRSAFHTPTLATIGADGTPRLRAMVLRGFDAATRSLRLHTDARAAKAADIKADPRAAMHVHDPAAQIQLRLSGTATLHHGDAVSAAGWAASLEFSRMCYAIEPAPGGLAAAPPAAPRDAEAGLPNFAVILFSFAVMEWLWLDAGGHRRACFDFATGDAHWLVP